MQDLKSFTSFIEKEIEKFSFPSSPENLYEPLRYFLKIGGKRMRPILTLLGGLAFDCEAHKTKDAALAVEFFHNFSLIHDDIMDEAPIRRGTSTIHEKWDQNIAILSGDVLLVKAYQILSSYDAKTFKQLMDLFNKTAIEVCEGQQLDMDFETRKEVKIEEYIEMIRLKTSVLLGCALEMGAIVANANPKDKELIYDFGVNIGVAFQIQDDILDLYADPEKFGKQVGGDILANKKTLLMLKAFEMSNEQQLKDLEALLVTKDPTKKVLNAQQLFNEIGVYQACESIKDTYYQKALKSLEQLSVSDVKKAPLKSLALYVMQRDV